MVFFNSAFSKFQLLEIDWTVWIYMIAYQPTSLFAESMMSIWNMLMHTLWSASHIRVTMKYSKHKHTQYACWCNIAISRVPNVYSNVYVRCAFVAILSKDKSIFSHFWLASFGWHCGEHVLAFFLIPCDRRKRRQTRHKGRGRDGLRKACSFLQAGRTAPWDHFMNISLSPWILLLLLV